MSERGEYVYGTDGNEGHWLTGERIVRCRDCAYMHHVTSCAGSPFHECWRWMRASVVPGVIGCVRVEPNGFCSWGERKEGK